MKPIILSFKVFALILQCEKTNMLFSLKRRYYQVSFTMQYMGDHLAFLIFHLCLVMVAITIFDWATIVIKKRIIDSFQIFLLRTILSLIPLLANYAVISYESLLGLIIWWRRYCYSVIQA